MSKKKTYNEARIEKLEKEVSYLQEKIKALREEVRLEKIRNEAVTVQFERMVAEVAEKNKTICQLTNKMLMMKEGS